MSSKRGIAAHVLMRQATGLKKGWMEHESI
nr:MAG TPA: hypothetical protein [Caudoviricetes sp.]